MKFHKSIISGLCCLTALCLSNTALHAAGDTRPDTTQTKTDTTETKADTIVPQATANTTTTPATTTNYPQTQPTKEQRLSLDERSLVFGIISIGILAVIACSVALVNGSKNKRFRKEINRLEWGLKKLSQSHKTQGENLNRMETEINRLSNRVAQSERSIPIAPTVQPVAPAPTERPTNRNREGYFGAVVTSGNGYFRRLLSVRDQDARFFARITDDRANFEPLSLQMVTSFDYMETAILFTGVGRKDARNMKTLEPGEARLQDGKWMITKQAKVQLY